MGEILDLKDVVVIPKFGIITQKVLDAYKSVGTRKELWEEGTEAEVLTTHGEGKGTWRKGTIRIIMEFTPSLDELDRLIDN